MPAASILALPEHSKHGFMSDASGFAGKLACGGVLCSSGGCFAPILAEKARFSNLHQMTSTPGFKLLFGHHIMLRCQNLRDHWGKRAGEGGHRDRCGRRRTSASLPMLQAATPIWHEVLGCFDASIKMGSIGGLDGNWWADSIHYSHHFSPFFVPPVKLHVTGAASGQEWHLSCFLPAAPLPTFFTPPCRANNQLANAFSGLEKVQGALRYGRQTLSGTVWPDLGGAKIQSLEKLESTLTRKSKTKHCNTRNIPVWLVETPHLVAYLVHLVLVSELVHA
eukprot:1159798-Pelagomonas_calceolata.AAC.3